MRGGTRRCEQHWVSLLASPTVPDDEVRSDLPASSAVLAPTSSRYQLVAHGRAIRLLVVVAMRQVGNHKERPPRRQGVPTEGDTSEDAPGRDVLGDTGEAGEEQEAAQSVAAGQGLGHLVELQGDKLDVEAHVEATLAPVLAAAGGLPVV